MFKKPFKVSSKNQLSGKDKKDLKIQMTNSLSPASVDAFFSQNSKLIAEKVTDLKISIFVNEEEDPIFIHFVKDNHYLPTIYVVSQYPDLVQSIWLKQGVEQFVFKGANVMCPGVEKFPELEEGKIVVVRNSKGVPVATGYMGTKGGEGVGCTVVHYMGDKLWEHGSKILSPIKFVEQKQKVEQKSSEVEITSQNNNQQSKQPKQQKQNADQSEQSQQQQQSKQQKDKLILDAFLNVLKLQRFTKQQLPMPVTTFFSKYIKVASPVPLDVAHSSYKKVATFIQVMAQKNLVQLIKTKDKSGNVLTISAIDRTHALVKQHTPTIQDLPKQQKQQLVLQKFKLVCSQKLQVLYKLTPPIQFLRAYTRFPQDITKQFDEKQLDYLVVRFFGQNKMKKYNKMIEINQKNRKNLRVKKQFIDIEYQKYPYLNQIIQKDIAYHLNTFKLEQQLNQTVQETVLKNVIPISLQSFTKNIFRLAIKTQHLVDQRTGVVQVLNTKKPFASIHLQAFKSHNKNVTTINNLQPFLCLQYKQYQQLQELADYLKLRYACGTSVRQSNQGKTQIYIQGNMFNEVMDFLVNEQGVDPSLIHGVNKLPKKKK